VSDGVSDCWTRPEYLQFITQELAPAFVDKPSGEAEALVNAYLKRCSTEGGSQDDSSLSCVFNKEAMAEWLKGGGEISRLRLENEELKAEIANMEPELRNMRGWYQQHQNDGPLYEKERRTHEETRANLSAAKTQTAQVQAQLTQTQHQLSEVSAQLASAQEELDNPRSGLRRKVKELKEQVDAAVRERDSYAPYYQKYLDEQRQTAVFRTQLKTVIDYMTTEAANHYQIGTNIPNDKWVSKARNYYTYARDGYTLLGDGERANFCRARIDECDRFTMQPPPPPPKQVEPAPVLALNQVQQQLILQKKQEDQQKGGAEWR
jgi:hypothetical protein